MNGTDTRSALLLAANVLGVGALFLPWTARAAYGEAAVAGWLYVVIAGGLLVLALTAAATWPGAGQGAAALTGRSLGEPFGRAVRTFYAIGVTAGQAVVALVAAGFLTQAAGGSGAASWWMAALVITAGTALAAGGRRVPARLSLPLFTAVVALLGVSVLLSHRDGAVPPASDPGLGWRPALSAAVLQLFVVVGWESTPGVPVKTGARRARGPLVAVALVGAVYAAALLVAGSATTVRAAPGLVLPDLGPGVGRAAALLAALTVALFCARNLSTAAGLAVEALTGAPATANALRRSALAVGAAALLGVALVTGRRLDATDVLSVPNAMALAVFLSVSASVAVADRRPRHRRQGVAALALHLPLSFFAGPALALPLLSLGTATVRATARTQRHETGSEELHTVGELTARHEKSGERYVEFLRTASLSAGLYALPAGASDLQRPHAQDELCVAFGGRATFRTGDEAHPVPGRQSATGGRGTRRNEHMMTTLAPPHDVTPSDVTPNDNSPNDNSPNDVSAFEQHESEVRLYSRKFPVVFTRGRGAWLHSEDGRDFLDFFCGASALNYGHNPPALKERLQSYVAQDGLIHGLDLYTAAKRDFLSALRRRVLDPHRLPHKVQFCGPTGTDAVEAALKVARKATGRRTVVAFAGAFHGMSRGSLSVTGSLRARAAGGVDLHDVLFVPYENGPGGPFDSIGYLERLLADPAGGVETPAAVIVEPVQVDGGVYPASADWLRRLRALTERLGMLLIFDDIQAGIGRSGDFFSFSHSGVVPDLITLSKSLSGYGLPLSVLLIAPGLDVWEPGGHTGTFRGNQLAFVTGAAALETWAQPEFTERLATNSETLQTTLRRFGTHRPDLAVRGRGMLVGIDVGDSGRAERIQKSCFDNGLILELCGREDQVVKLMPPLNIDPDDLRKGIAVVEAAVTDA